MPDMPTCNLFGHEATTRIFLLIRATGGVSLSAAMRVLGLTALNEKKTFLERFLMILRKRGRPARREHAPPLRGIWCTTGT